MKPDFECGTNSKQKRKIMVVLRHCIKVPSLQTKLSNWMLGLESDDKRSSVNGNPFSG